MKNLVSTWLLAGALAASLAWNLRGAACGSAAAPAACGATEAACSIDLAALGLSAEQRRSLERSGAEACAGAEQLGARANALQAELCGRLAAREVDVEAVRGLAREIGDLRRRSLEACIDSVLEVRALLGPEQVALLFAACDVSCERVE